jgi:hypothetical protein
MTEHWHHLKNGAVMHRFTQTAPGEGIVLAHTPGDWVTWVIDIETGNTFWGDYQRTYEQALESFNKRVAA